MLEGHIANHVPASIKQIVEARDEIQYSFFTWRARNFINLSIPVTSQNSRLNSSVLLKLSSMYEAKFQPLNSVSFEDQKKCIFCKGFSSRNRVIGGSAWVQAELLLLRCITRVFVYFQPKSKLFLAKFAVTSRVGSTTVSSRAKGARDSLDDPKAVWSTTR